MLDFLCCLLGWQFIFTNQERDLQEDSTYLLSRQCLFEPCIKMLVEPDLSLNVCVTFPCATDSDLKDVS